MEDFEKKAKQHICFLSDWLIKFVTFLCNWSWKQVSLLRNSVHSSSNKFVCNDQNQVQNALRRMRMNWTIFDFKISCVSKTKQHLLCILNILNTRWILKEFVKSICLHCMCLRIWYAPNKLKRNLKTSKNSKLKIKSRWNFVTC